MHITGLKESNIDSQLGSLILIKHHVEYGKHILLYLHAIMLHGDVDSL